MLTTALEVTGVALICAALVVLLGLAGMLAAAGGLALLASWVIETRR
ncbi:MAG: hypothetical protein R2686_07185 [Candidatus Nanopelagicales bacterium]